MGKVLKKLSEIRATPTYELMARFKHLIGAKAIREYLAAKVPQDLSIEIRLTEEEVLRRVRSNIRYKNNKEKTL